MAARFDRQQMMELDPAFLRMHLRERLHHTVEHQLYSAIYGERELGPAFGRLASEILAVWEERGLPTDLPDIRWARTLLELSERVKRGEKVDPPGGYLPRPLPEEDLGVWKNLLFGRRSYRQWEDTPVASQLVEQVLEAGMWAASGCNLEIWRFLVIEDPKLLHRWHNLEFEVEKVKIICCMDVRGYDHVDYPPPEKNKLLDVGACMQNMALTAHALGLGGCWSTFSPQQIQDIHDYFDLPDYVEVVTYLSLGWAREKVIPPARMSYRDAILAWPGREAADGEE
ncbi:MAG: nitroreductase family protein [Clostridia bacterium]